MTIAAMKQALEALQGGTGNTRSWHLAIEDAIAALRAAIQQAEAEAEAHQPAATEPVWFHKHWCDGDDIFYRPDDRIPAGATPLYTRPAADDAVKDAERYQWLVSWLQQMNLLTAEFGQMGKGEKPSDWWMLNAPYGIDKTRPFFGHGKTVDAAIDAAMRLHPGAEGGE